MCYEQYYSASLAHINYTVKVVGRLFILWSISSVLYGLYIYVLLNL